MSLLAHMQIGLISSDSRAHELSFEIKAAAPGINLVVCERNVTVDELLLQSVDCFRLKGIR